MTPTALASSCGIFERMAKATISLKQNTNPILEEISSAKDYDKRVEIAKKHWEKLGEGSARAVFRINEKLIIKVAINDKGIAQNLSEMRPECRSPCAVPVIMGDAKGKWLIARWTKTITKEEFKKYVGFGFDAFVNCLKYAFNNESDRKRPKDYDKIKHNELFSCLARLVIDNELLTGDLAKPSSYGLLNGKVVARDLGFSREIFKRFYDKDTSSETTDRTSSSGSG
jgi:hypothetical protein